jgi:GTPase SAR1 family protein
MIQVRGKFVSLKVWDIGGQSIHSKNIKQYVGSSNAIFLVYDVTNPESFSNLEDWLGLVRKHSTAKHVYIVGNKIDLIALRQITEAQHGRFILQNDLQGGMFMSAKSGENVVKAFYQVAGDIIGIKLTQYELAFHDKVITATIQVPQADNEGRTAFADEIEAEDLALEAKKNQKKKSFCICS